MGHLGFGELFFIGGLLISKILPVVAVIFAIKYFVSRSHHRQDRDLESDSRLARLESEVDDLRREVSDTQERADYLERRLAWPQSEPRDPVTPV